jgi:hypothetical protein
MPLFRTRRTPPAAANGRRPSEPDFAGSNPLLLAQRADPKPAPAEVEALTARYAFAIPTDAALRAIADASPTGVIELGAGTGYWASLLHEAGVDVVAFDRAPPGSPDNNWFHSSTPWFPVEEGDEAVVDRHADRTLLIVWPTRDEVWPAEAIERFYVAGGTTVVYVGEAPGGATGDLRFHRLLGEVDLCLACAYGIRDYPCVCDVTAQWQRVRTVALPHWPGQHDDLHVYRPLPQVRPSDRGN